MLDQQVSSGLAWLMLVVEFLQGHTRSYIVTSFVNKFLVKLSGFLLLQLRQRGALDLKTFGSIKVLFGLLAVVD